MKVSEKVRRNLWLMILAAHFVFGGSTEAQAAPWDVTLPLLMANGSNGLVTLSWPTWAVHSKLETARGARWENDWAKVWSVKAIEGDEIVTSFPATNDQQLFRLAGSAGIPLFQFNFFYNGDMELNGAATLHVRGRVHANGNLYTGSNSDQYFYEDVTVGGVIQHGMRYGWATNGTVYYYSGLALTNAPRLTLAMGTNIAPDFVREIIQVPPTDEPPDSPLARERYFNKAEMIILVTNAAVEVFLKEPFSAVRTPIDWLQVTNFVSTNKTFTDQRAGFTTVRTTEIDVGKFNAWAATNATVVSLLGAGIVPNVLYVADRRLTNSSRITAVRIVNAQTLSSRGLTVATMNPLYTKGHFNQPTIGHLGTTNTSNTRPASLVCDAYTLLSGSFNDAASSGSYSSRPASNTTVVAAIITGNVPSGPGYSGGANNLPRLLEAWSGRTYTLNGSLVCLYTSAIATSPFLNPGVYYSAPTRNINFDSNFLDPTKLPPGTPYVGVTASAK